jgi:hypothetical protein
MLTAMYPAQEDVESTFKSNIIQMFAITKFALPHMEKGGS